MKQSKISNPQSPTPSSKRLQVTIFTDGACLGNPGRGGYGVVLLQPPYRKELSGGYRLTTNNRMELMAVIAGLRILKKPCDVTLYSDSRYLVDALEKGWAERWRKNDWMRNTQAQAENADLWAQLLDLCARHVVKFVWVRGHTGNRENERCDQLSVQAAQGKNLRVDEGYERAGAAHGKRLDL
jgi:ribonuclease HI